MQLTVTAVLNGAADLIETAPTLAQNAFWLPAEDVDQRCYCAVGAIMQAHKTIQYVNGGKPSVSGLLVNTACILLATTLQLPFLVGNAQGAEVAIYDWNDADGRTKAEVTTALRTAARSLTEVAR